MAIDVLSDVLRVVRLSGAVFFTAEFSSPWAVESPPPEALAAIVMPDAECVALFHVLIDGECVVGCQSHPAVQMGNRRRDRLSARPFAHDGQPRRREGHTHR